MMWISIENYSWKTQPNIFAPYKKFLLEETLETIKTFWKLIKSTLKWEKESHAHLLKCSDVTVLIVSSRESFNINVVDWNFAWLELNGILHKFILGRLFIEICVFYFPSGILSFSTLRMDFQADQPSKEGSKGEGEV